MPQVFKSIEYDLGLFDVNQIKSAMITSDKDSGVSIELSFDGGSTFRVYTENEKFEVNSQTAKIRVKIIFSDSYTGQYKITATGNFPMLAIGTSLYFSSSVGKTYKTTIGTSGSYSIDLPDSTYRVWYLDSDNKEITIDQYYIPKLRIDNREPKAKEAMVEMFIRDLSWAKYCIFDVYENLDKITTTSASLDVYGNLINYSTGSVCRWWALGFTDE